MTDDKPFATIRVDVSRLDTEGNRTAKASFFANIGDLSEAAYDAIKESVRRDMRALDRAGR